MTDSTRELHVAEVSYENGQIRLRYSQYKAEDGSEWVRHGPFVQYHRNGQVASEGEYVDGLEEGRWRRHHENGQLAAEGAYRAGRAVGTWRFWTPEGVEEEPEEYEPDGGE